MRVQALGVAAAISLTFGSSAESRAQWTLDFESGVAVGGYNDVGIPGTTGTRFSLTDDFDPDPQAFWRMRVGRRFGERHRLSLLIAPLRLQADGRPSHSITFTNVTFPAETELRSLYRFDSYRLTYAYDVYRRKMLRIAAGATAKIRDAAIRLTSDAQVAEKSNTGFVPLLHLAVDWDVSSRLRVVLDVDALAAPQGRAEDILLALSGRLNDSLGLRAGYRMLEGGADNDEVYNFTLVNYALVGMAWEF
jgi:hypothetical protein